MVWIQAARSLLNVFNCSIPPSASDASELHLVKISFACVAALVISPATSRICRFSSSTGWTEASNRSPMLAPNSRIAVCVSCRVWGWTCASRPASPAAAAPAPPAGASTGTTRCRAASAAPPAGRRPSLMMNGEITAIAAPSNRTSTGVSGQTTMPMPQAPLVSAPAISRPGTSLPRMFMGRCFPDRCLCHRPPVRRTHRPH